jgi:hypothetical protein
MPRAAPHRALLCLRALFGATAIGSAHARARVQVRTSQDRLHQGTHWRIVAPEGVLHVLRPAGYRRATAGVVLYVHGFNTTADRAWKRHGLATQLCASRRNALQIVVEGARSLEDGVKFTSLARVLELVARHTGLTLPSGRVVAMGHSGGYWTGACWLDHTRLDSVNQLDGMYGFMDDFRRWNARPGHRLVFVARGTRGLSRRVIRGMRGAVERRGVPRRARDFTARQRKARVLHIDSQYSHNGIVRSRRVIPVVLKLTGLAPLA